MGKILENYSFGIGDRFARQGGAQLEALKKAKNLGVNIVPVWNKSYREHAIINTKPYTVRNEADTAVKTLNWLDSYYVDADHITLENVDYFIESSDFFTLDVADYTGKPADENNINAFIEMNKKYIGNIEIPGIGEPLSINMETLKQIARKYLSAVLEAGRIYRHIEEKKGTGYFITEFSIDETDKPQSPVEMLFILSAIAKEGIPVQTVAPKFTGRFNKSVDYVGDLNKFTKEFNDDLAVISFAIKEFNLPSNLKLSIHSGSDKFSIFEPIKQAIKKHNTGMHIKTSGTTWLEELIGLACGGGEGLSIAKEIYRKSYNRFDELCKPYASVIDIDRQKLPDPDQVDKWDEVKYAETVRHVQSNPLYNVNVRQLLSIGYRIAAEMGDRYYNALEINKKVIAENVMENIFDRHIKRIFL